MIQPRKGDDFVWYGWMGVLPHSAVQVLIFGPDKLPAMAKTLGKAINKFQKRSEEMNKVIKTEV